MLYREEVRDLFSVPDDYYLAHCVSADFGMGKGIVVEFNKRFDMKNKLQNKYPRFVLRWDLSEAMFPSNGFCLLEGRVFNLITKRNYWLKPTYQTLETSLRAMRRLAIDNGITKIAMPILGCGLDRLQWGEVSQIIKDVFSDTDIEILVCKRE